MGNEFKRGAGVLLPVSSLPSKYGIGTFGKEAYDFVDKLEKASQKYWQVLPLGPTSYGDSPYQSPSAFAGNPYFIDLDILIEQGLLEEQEILAYDFGDNEEYVDYEKMYNARYKVLKTAYLRFKQNIGEEYYSFVEQEKEWLEDYALFMACKEYFDQKVWTLWDDDIKYRHEDAIVKYKEMLADNIAFNKFLQYEFYRQWMSLKTYANSKNLEIIGDMPIYVSYDSADVWVNTGLFQLDDNLVQTAVAGCPPDAFSDDGQKWGNPLYAWDKHEAEGFAWFKKRMKALSRLYDVIRIDHFIGVVRYYCIPYDKTAKFGWYEKGPGIKLANAIKEAIGDAKIIAEDLGVLTPEVTAVLEEAGFPGMKELAVAFDGNPYNDHLPHFHKKHGVVYIGTHDNETLKGQCEHMSKEGFDYMMKYIGATSTDEIIPKMIRVLYMSIADTIIVQMQDILEKGNEARMNLPATVGNNWKWRLMKDEFTSEHCEMLKELAFVYGR